MEWIGAAKSTRLDLLRFAFDGVEGNGFFSLRVI
jgi:hypothetical protein